MRPRANLIPAKFVAAVMQPYRALQRLCFERRLSFRAALDELCHRWDRCHTGPGVLVDELAADIRAGNPIATSM